MIKREVKLETMLARLIERDGYSRNRQPILDSINVTAAALSQYTRGRTRPSFDKLVALADFFGVSLDYLVYGEPASIMVDPTPMTSQVRHAIVEERVRANQHSELVARFGRMIMDRVGDIAQEVLEKGSAGLEGLIEINELIRVEQYCRTADIVTTDLASDILITEDSATPGQFFPVVVENLTRGCTYRFLLAGDLTTQSPIVTRFRSMIRSAVGGDRLHEYCHFRTTAWPVASAAVLYQLDTAKLAKLDQAIYAQFSKYLLDEDWLGYVNRPTDESTADMLMTPSHVERARKAFDVLWDAATM